MTGNMLVNILARKHVSEYIGSHKRSLNHSSSIKTSLQRSAKKDQIDAQSLKVHLNLYIMANFGATKTWLLYTDGCYTETL